MSVRAEEQSGWQFDSLRANSNLSKPDAQQVHEVTLKMLDRWNAHDLEGYMEVYWNSPELLVVVDSEQFNGWQQLHDSYVNGYPDRNSMGFIQPTRIQVKVEFLSGVSSRFEREQGDLMPQLHQRIAEVRDNPFRAAIQLRRHSFIQRSNLRDSHVSVYMGTFVSPSEQHWT